SLRARDFPYEWQRQAGMSRAAGAHACWRLLSRSKLREPAVGIEPTTARLQIGCSTAQLRRRRTEDRRNGERGHRCLAPSGRLPAHAARSILDEGAGRRKLVADAVRGCEVAAAARIDARRDALLDPVRESGLDARRFFACQSEHAEDVVHAIERAASRLEVRTSDFPPGCIERR